MQRDIDAACRCGATALRTRGTPITVVTCYCKSCMDAAEQFEQELGSASVIKNDGGVEYVLFRKDRIEVLRGHEYLREHRLSPEATTRRVIADCCGTPLFLDFTPGHWVSLYRSALVGQAPVSRLRAHTPRFMLALLSSWTAMGFRRPRIKF